MTDWQVVKRHRFYNEATRSDALNEARWDAQDLRTAGVRSRFRCDRRDSCYVVEQVQS